MTIPTVIDVDLTTTVVDVRGSSFMVDLETRGMMKGDPGADGRMILTGTAPPTTEGTEGDIFLEFDEVGGVAWIYGPKAGGVWPAGLEIVGGEGTPGPPGEPGPPGDNLVWTVDPADDTALLLDESGEGGGGGGPGAPANIYKFNVKDSPYNAKGDGVTDDAAAIQMAIDDLPAGGTLYFPEGIYIIGTTILLPQYAGCSIQGTSVPTNAWLSATVLRAKTGSNLVAIMASPEWYLNGLPGGAKDKAVSISNLTFYGGGFAEGDGFDHDNEIEDTAHTDYCLVVHGSNIKVQNVTCVSANLDTFLVAGNTGRTGGSISETHEMWIFNCGFRYAGRDGFHALAGAKDNYIGYTKVQYAGRHGFCNDNGASAWVYDHNHPSRCGSDMIHVDATWECMVNHNYLDAVGDFMDGVATVHRSGTAKRYGIYAGGGNDNIIHIDHNYMHTESTGGQVQPVVGLYLKGFVIATYNTLRYQGSDASVIMIENDGTTTDSQIVGNVRHKPGDGV